MTTVVNRGHQPYGVYIGRAYSMLPQSPYHNPYYLGKDGNREEVLLKFAIYWYAPEQKALRERARAELAHRILGCWCKPKACHGDIIAGYVNWREVMESPTNLNDARGTSPTAAEWKEISQYILKHRVGRPQSEWIGISKDGSIVFRRGVLHPMAFLDVIRNRDLGESISILRPENVDG